MSEETSQESVIVTPEGRPAREAVKKSDRCPVCGRGPEHRIASGGFGQIPHPICGSCGYEWHGEVFGG